MHFAPRWLLTFADLLPELGLAKVAVCVSGVADYVDESDSIYFKSMCPKCGRQQGQYGLTRSALRRLITKGQPVQGYCVTCDAFWSVSDAERAEINRKLTE
jgi:hypothetical protein